MKVYRLRWNHKAPSTIKLFSFNLTFQQLVHPRENPEPQSLHQRFSKTFSVPRQLGKCICKGSFLCSANGHLIEFKSKLRNRFHIVPGCFFLMHATAFIHNVLVHRYKMEIISSDMAKQTFADSCQDHMTDYYFAYLFS